MSEIETNKIYNESCLDTMSCIPDNFVDLVITLPPYNMNLRIRNGKYCSRQIVKEFSTKYSNFSDNMPMDEYYNFHKEVMLGMLRISKMVFYNIQVVTGNKNAVFKLMGYFSDQIKDIVIWDKGYGQPAMHKGILNAQHELILILGDNPIARAFTNPYFNRGELSNVWKIPRERSTYKKHGAIFPEKLVETILENFSKEGDVIYDPFMGLGTTAVVAKRMGRNYIGSEISQEYCIIAEERLTNE